MNKFKPNDLVYRKIERDKYGIGVVIDDYVICDPGREKYSVVSWIYPVGSGNGLNQFELNENLIPTTFDNIKDRKSREWVQETIDFYKNKYKDNKPDSKKKKSVTDYISIFRKNMRDIDEHIKKVKTTRMKWLHHELKFMKMCLQRMDDIGIPTNDEETNKLRECIYAYEDALTRIEHDFISNFRRYIK